MRSIGVLACLVALASCEEKKKEETPSTPPPAVSTSATAAQPSAAPSTTAVPDAIAAQHVLVAWKGAQGAPKTVTRSKADAKKLADDIAARAAKGEEFSSLVAQYSDDPGSKERQGSVGKFTREKMTKPFSDAAFALPVGGVSGAVESAFGYHVIKRNQ